MLASLLHRASDMINERPLPRQRCGLLVWLLTFALALIGVVSAAAAAPFAYVSNFASDTVSVIDAATNSVVTVDLPPGANPHGVAVNPAGTHVYVANYGNGTVSVIETAGNTVVATFNVGNSPRGIAVNATGTRVYVANEGDATVSVIDTELNKVDPINGLSAPFGVAVNPARPRVYVTDTPNIVRVIDADTNLVLTSIEVGFFPLGVAVNPAGTRVYVANQVGDTVSVIDTTTYAVATVSLAVGSSPTAVAVSPSGTLVYVTNSGEKTVSVIDAKTNAFLTNVLVGGSPYGVATDPTGAFVFVGIDMGTDVDGTVSVIDAATTTVVATVTVGKVPDAFGAFVTVGIGSACSDQLDALKQQLAAANAALASLGAENAKLKSALAGDDQTIASFVNRLFGGRTDANVANAARDAAQQLVVLALEKAGAHDRRVRHAQEELNEGLTSLAAGRFQRAVNEFRDAVEIARRVLRR